MFLAKPALPLVALWAALSVCCNRPLSKSPAHLNVVIKKNQPEPGVQINLLPFKNKDVELKNATFEFQYLGKQDGPIKFSGTIYRPITVGVISKAKLPYAGVYRVTIRTPGFNRASFDLKIESDDLVLIETSLEFNPQLAFELKSEF